jgi:hypothetical protein
MSSKPAMPFVIGPIGSLVLDPSFPRIAAKAAVEVDGALLRVQGKQAPKELQTVGVMALLPCMRRIVEATLKTSPYEAISETLDPVSENVFLRAYGKIDPEAARTRDSLKNNFGQAAHRLTKVLEQVANKEAPPIAEDLAYARNFCRALSDQAAVRQYSPHSATPQGFLRRLS